MIKKFMCIKCGEVKVEFPNFKEDKGPLCKEDFLHYAAPKPEAVPEPPKPEPKPEPKKKKGWLR